MKKSYLKRILLLWCLISLSASVYSQTGSVSGLVVDETGQPLPGASVSIKAINRGTSTDAKGEYRLASVPRGRHTITASFVGYQLLQQEVNVTGDIKVNLKLAPSSQSLSEVVVVGYGTQKRGDLTGSIASVSAKEFNRGVVGSADQLLVGKVPGLTISRGGGDPTAGSNIQLRGPSSLTASTSPFYVIDGVPDADINVVAPEDIVSIDVLKDASSTAIYGSRAANGVIMVTTRRGKEGKPSLSYSGYAALENVSNKVEVLNAEEYRAFLTANNMQVSASEDGSSTNWQDQLYRQGISHNHNLSLNGGSQDTKYSASLNYFKNDGIVKHNDLERVTGRVTLDQNAFEGHVRLGLTLSNSNAFSNHVDYNIFNGAARYLPVSPIMSDDPAYSMYGGYFQVPGRTNYYNPVAMLNQRSESQERNTTLANGKIGIDLLPGLVFDASGSIQRRRYDQIQYYSRQDFSPQAIGLGWANRRSTKDTDKILETILTYSKTYKEHSLKVLGGYSYQNTINGDGLAARTNNFTSDELGAGNLDTGNPIDGYRVFQDYPQKQESTLISFFGRVNYNYASRYILSATIRRDGSSRFGANNRWALFPSFGAAWRVSQENFMKDQTLFSDLKLRVGYGESGNQNIAPYRSLLQFAAGSQFMYNGKYISSYGPSTNPNPDLKWETTSMFNLGLDFAILKNRINGTIEYYNKETKDLLYEYSVPTPPYIFNTLLANGASMSNKGVEFTLSASVLRQKDLTWSSSINLSHNSNKIGSLNSNIGNLAISERYEGGFDGFDGWTGETVSIVKPGYAIGTFYTRQYVGYDAEARRTIYRKANGELATADHTAARTDYVVAGHALPKLTYGWNNTFNYKKFDLSFFIRGVYGNDIFNATRADLSRLTQATVTNISPKAVEEGIFEVPVASSRFIEDGSFIRLDNATLGYTLNVRGVKYVKNARIYLTGQNIFTITNYSGVDPELNLGGLSPGIDNRNYYPKTRSFLLGINVGF